MEKGCHRAVPRWPPTSWLLEQLEGAYGADLIRLWCATLAGAPGRWSSHDVAKRAGQELGEQASRRSWHVERALKPYLEEQAGKLRLGHRTLEETACRRYALAGRGTLEGA